MDNLEVQQKPKKEIQKLKLFQFKYQNNQNLKNSLISKQSSRISLRNGGYRQNQNNNNDNIKQLDNNFVPSVNLRSQIGSRNSQTDNRKLKPQFDAMDVVGRATTKDGFKKYEPIGKTLQMYQQNKILHQKKNENQIEKINQQQNLQPNLNQQMQQQQNSNNINNYQQKTNYGNFGLYTKNNSKQRVNNQFANPVLQRHLNNNFMKTSADGFKKFTFKQKKNSNLQFSQQQPTALSQKNVISGGSSLLETSGYQFTQVADLETKNNSKEEENFSQNKKINANNMNQQINNTNNNATSSTNNTNPIKYNLNQNNNIYNKQQLKLNFQKNPSIQSLKSLHMQSPNSKKNFNNINININNNIKKRIQSNTETNKIFNNNNNDFDKTKRQNDNQINQNDQYYQSDNDDQENIELDNSDLFSPKQSTKNVNNNNKINNNSVKRTGTAKNKLKDARSKANHYTDAVVQKQQKFTELEKEEEFQFQELCGMLNNLVTE